MSPTRFSSSRPVFHAVAIAGFCGVVAPAAGDPVRGIRALTDRPIAPLGGVLMVPLGALAPGDQWPSTMELTGDDGRAIPARVVWIHPRPAGRVEPRRWTHEPNPLAVRPIRPDDDSRQPDAGAPFLLARLPHRRLRSLSLGPQVLLPAWGDPMQPYTRGPLPGLDRPMLARTDSPDRPDPVSPFAYWRWVLLADRLDHRPPPFDVFNEVEAMVAERETQVWRIALGHLAQHSLRAAASCRDVLTRVCTDRPDRFAGWVVSPAALDELRSSLLDFGRGGPDLVNDALAWVETRRALAAWTEAEVGDQVTIALLNRSFSLLVARLTWDGAASNPITVELPPGELTRVRIDRPPRRRSPTVGLYMQDDPDVSRLGIKAGHEMLRLSFGPRAVPVRPPGVMLPTFRRPLTLADLDAERLAPVPPEYATSAHIRFLMGRWELFIECRRPYGVLSGAADPFGRVEHAEEIRLVEAVTLFLGPAGRSTAVLAIPESGAPRSFRGADAAALEVYRRSYPDRWYCRVVLPPAWLEATGEAPTLIGALRSHGDGKGVETTPNTCTPWRFQPSRIAFDLTRWDDRRWE